MILVVTEKIDQHADRVIEDLESRDQTVARFAPSQYPTRACLSFRCGDDERLVLDIDGSPTDLGAVSAVWWRRPSLPEVHPDVHPDVREYARRECVSLVADMLASLACPFVPGTPSTVHRAEHKTAQLRLAKRLGFDIPDTLVTSDRAAALSFWQRHEGNVLAKVPNSTPFQAALGDTFCRYADRVTHRDLMYLDDLRFAPVAFQAYVHKKVELRVTVFGDQVWSVEIDSQASNQACEDWRHYDLHQTPHRLHVLPEVVRQRCVGVVRSLGLTYGAIDLILTPDDRYVFLGINPSGQYLWLEQVAGFPLTRAMSDLLLNLAKRAP